MTPLVPALTDTDLRNLAAFYARGAGTAPDAAAALAAPAGQDTPDPQKLARGEQLFREGDAARGVPPCAGCHGGEGKGHPLAGNAGIAGAAYYRSYPALRGQKAPFLVGRLNEFRNRELTDTSNDFIMQGVAAHLDDESIDALTTWLSSLPPP
jgi:cytochrome c553